MQSQGLEQTVNFDKAKGWAGLMKMCLNVFLLTTDTLVDSC